MISEEVKLVFEMPKIDKVWAGVKRIGLDTETLSANFNGYSQGRRFSDPLLQPRLIFLEWGEAHLQPILNRTLNRPFTHPTFNAMMLYCLREEIAYYHSQRTGGAAHHSEINPGEQK